MGQGQFENQRALIEYAVAARVLPGNADRSVGFRECRAAT
jgi:hypothetical protein